MLLLLLTGAYYGFHLSGWWIVLLFLIHSVLLILGAIYIRWNFYLKSFAKGVDNYNQLALTFDDGPNTETAAILDILKKHNIPAAFFAIGKNASTQPELVKRWHEEGHITGNHTFYHGIHFDWKSAKKMEEEICQTNKTIESIIGKQPRFFRPPYGVTNPNLAKAIRLTNMYSIAWNIRSFDTSANSAEQLLHRILKKLQSGDIILLHDSVPHTREILTELIIQSQQKGFTFVRLDKMLALDAYA